ncbi:hypothetical protein ACTFIN_06235 [Clostridium cagae]|uniref:hypothetical protein n=1 Tax=Clostridium TaxID=1485 RepID=UPI0020795A95|nr:MULTISPECIES: hypothetical protein [unclassified Clostridium]
MKKISKICLSCVIGIMAMSSVAYASPINYSFRLPATGSRSTDNAYKATNNDVATNNVSSLGWEGSKIVCWVCDNDGGKISSNASFSKAKNVNIYMDKSLAKENKGSYVFMKLKTSAGTMNKCDISGEFNPN